MDNVFKKACGLVNYSTYRKFNDFLLFSGVGTSFINFILSINDINVVVPMPLIANSFYLLYFYLYIFDGKKYVKDISEIRGLYYEFINNYDKLNKMFDLKDPVSIYTMFNYLLYQGFLSKDKHFEFSGVGVKDIPTTDIGVNVINGCGVCRHVSSMMCDILNHSGISSANIGCFVRDIDMKLEEVAFQDYSREDVITWINKNIIDEEKRRMLIDKINSLETKGVYISVDSSYKEDYGKILDKKRYGNHLITYSLYDGKSFYLDPTQGRIYRMNEEGNLFDNYDDKILVKKASFRLFNDSNSREIYKLKEKILLFNESISLEEEEYIIKNTKDICMKNMDVFEKFYDENKGLYEEISSKLVKVKIK